MKKSHYLALPLTIIMTAIVTFVVSLYLFERDVFDDSVEQKKLFSASLEEEREYLVHLPKSYWSNPNKRYPVIYVLDGSSQDLHTAASAELMARIEVIPEIIVVGIPNISGQGRQRDYTPPQMRQDIDDKDSPEGQADKFLSFINKELIPEIDKSYRTTSNRVLAGNSRGGLFVVYAFMAEPSLFQTYFANSPALWREEQKIVKLFDGFLRNNGSISSSLFLSLGSEENDKMKAAFKSTINVLESRAPSKLRWHSYFTSGANHGNNAKLATPVALRWAFDSSWDSIEKDSLTMP